jgi:hypothetical protein
LYSRFAFLAFLALLAVIEISNLPVINILLKFDSRRLHHISRYGPDRRPVGEAQKTLSMCVRRG